MPPTSVHFNGSVNLPDAETVMREISSRIPSGVRRMTDGEPGDRNYWISFQTRKFEQMPEFEALARGPAYETTDDAPAMPQLRLAAGASADTIQWPNLGYADEYAKSFATFERLCTEGTIPAGVRFQMQYPTPLASMAGTIAPDDMPAVARSYEQALFADLDTALERLPHGRVAVQWDVAIEFGALEGAMGPKIPIDQIAPGLVRCIERVPGDVPVGMHLCYGDYGHQHFKQPESLRMQVDLVNAVTAAASRPVNFLSFTVPQGRGDAAYFEPLGDLQTGSETELYFALVPYHPEEQAPSTTAEQIEHIDAALLRSSGGTRDWGICTECGMGRVDAGDVPRLLDLHKQILAT
ncbi:MAG: uroporphyrinogen decarboxylase/cobalamine-independent methonine synthase family protein [Solirubrobacteraceae bacterium]